MYLKQVLAESDCVMHASLALAYFIESDLASAGWGRKAVLLALAWTAC